MKTPLLFLSALLVVSGASAQLDEDTILTPIIPFQIGVAELAVDGSERSTPFELEGEVRDVYVRVLTESGTEARVEVETPDGRRIDLANAESHGAVAQVREFEESIDVAGMLTLFEQGRHWVLKVPNGGPGRWTVHVRAAPGATEPNGALVRIYWDGEGGRIPPSTETFSVGWTTPFLSAQVGRPVVYEACLYESEVPVRTGGKAFLVATAPSGAEERVEMLDDGAAPDRQAGDGFFAANFTPKETGEHQIRLHAASPKKPDSWRIQTVDLTVVPLSGDLTGNVRVTGLDEDGDGKPEEMAVFGEVEVLGAGRFNTRVWLDDGSEWGFHEYGAANLEPGRRWIQTRFDLEDLQKRGMTAPYRIRQVSLALNSPKGGSSSLERRELSISADPTQRVEPTPEPVRLAGALRTEKVDEDGDGLAERLRLTVPLEIHPDDEVLDGGLYLLAFRGQGNLRESVKHEIDFRNKTLSGKTDLVLELEGKRIAFTDFSGPFKASLGVRTWFGKAEFDLGETEELRAEEFAGEQPKILSLTQEDPAYAGEYAKMEFEYEGINPRARPQVVQVGEIRVPARIYPVRGGAAEATFIVPWNAQPGEQPLRLRAGTREALAPKPIMVEPARVGFVEESEADSDVVATGRVRLVETERGSYEYRVEADVRRSTKVRPKIHFYPNGQMGPGAMIAPMRAVAVSPGRIELKIPANLVELAVRGHSPNGIDRIWLGDSRFPVRELTLETDVSALPSIEVAGPQTARAEDADGNGLFDGLVFGVPLRIRNADALGDLFAYGGIYATATGRTIDRASPASNHVPPVDGLQTLQILVPGASIAASGQDGPYWLDEVLINFQKGQVQIPLEGVSPPFRAEQFDPEAVFTKLSSSGSVLRTPQFETGEMVSEALDDDGDGLYDRLVFRLPVEMAADQPLERAGISLSLAGATGPLDAWVQAQPQTLEPGSNELVAWVAAATTRLHDSEGPYEVTRANLSADGLVAVALPVEHRTAAYRGSDFSSVVPRLVRGWVRGTSGAVDPGGTAKISVKCDFTQCQDGPASSSDDVTIKSVRVVQSGVRAVLEVSVAADAVEGWRPLTIQTADGPLTNERAFRVLP